MIRGVLFDKDGTLLDFNGTWIKPCFEASQYLADCVGKPDLADRLMKNGGYIAQTKSWQIDSLLASGSNDQIFSFWENETGSPLSDQQIKHLQEIFAHGAKDYVPAIDDMGHLFQSLRDKGIKLGLATMDDEINARGMLKKLNLTQYFDFICGADSGYGLKPEPGMVNGFCDCCQLMPADIFMVGDSPRDLNMGKNAAVGKTVGVLTGAHNRPELEIFADVVIDDISGLLDLL